MSEKPGWDGVDRRQKQERPVPEGYMGPPYHYDRFDGVERRQSEHEKRISKIAVKVDIIEHKLDEHGEMLKGIGESFNPLMNVLEALNDWAILFGYFMAFCRWLVGPVGTKLVILIILLVYYLRTGDWAIVVRKMLE